MTAPASPKLGQGDVEIVIDGDIYVLKPTIQVAQQLSRRYGSLNDVIQKIGNLDFNAVVDVICLGLGSRYSTARQQNDISEKVFKTGLTDDTGGIAERCIAFVLSVMRGGKPASTVAVEPEAPTEGN
jgi:hypothetical protein